MLCSLRRLLIWCLMLALPVQSLAAAAMRSCHSADVGQAVTAHAGHHPDAVSADSSDRCSACALCHLGAAWIPVPPATPEMASGWQAVTLTAPTVHSFVPGGLERPPRNAPQN